MRLRRKVRRAVVEPLLGELIEPVVRLLPPNPMSIPFVKLDEQAIPPRNAYGNDAGWDLFCLEDTIIREGEGKDVRTGLTVAIPDGYFGRIVARSSTMRKRGLMVLEGIIDAGFRGELFSYVYFPTGLHHPDRRSVVLIEQGQSVAQLIIQPRPTVEFVETDALPQSLRGEKGFGSSGT